MVIKKCAECKKNITKKSPGLECSRCNKVVHADPACSKLSNKQLNTLRNAAGIEWSCESCQLNASRRSSFIIPDDADDDESDSGHIIGRQPILDTRKLVQDISRDLKKTFREELGNVESSLEFLIDQVSTLEKASKNQDIKIKELEHKNQDLYNKNKNLELRVAALEQGITQFEQKTLTTSLEIAGIPDSPSQDITKVLTTIATKLSVDQAGIQSSRRLTSGKDKPCTILVEMNSTTERNRWIAASKEKRLTVATVLPEAPKEKADHRVYVREALTKKMKTLLYNAKQQLRDTFQFVWYKDGKDLPIWMSLVLAVITLGTPAQSSEPRVVCYYTNWSVYRPGTAKFNPQNINPYLCTHLIYAFGGFTKENTLKPFDKYQDIEKGGYAKFTGLKTYNKNLKTLLAIGGWNEGSSRFSPMVASRERRREFVRNAIKFLRQNRFDGLDLDWEYPAARDGSKPKDRENYAKLVKELREEFERESQKTGKPRLLLTMAVPAGIDHIKKGFDVKTLNQYLDWMNLLTYDYHSAFEPAVNHHAPLYPLEEPNEYSVDNELNIDYTIKFYIENGADPEKLVLGIPTYGRSYTLFNPEAVEIGAPADGPGEQGDATREKGYLAYYEICEAIKPKQRKRSIDDDEDEDSEESDSTEVDLPWTVMNPNPKAMGPVAYRGNQWVGYDDIEMVKRKAEYVAENGLGGIMFWSVDNDDFRGNCHGKPYPLIEAAKEAYIVKLGATDNAIVTDRTQVTRGSAKRRNRPRASTTTTTTTAKPATAAKTLSSKRKSGSSYTSTTPAWNIITPEPPTTPDPGADFKCTDEGFFQHPRDCKKYFWCLDSGPSNLGIVAHQFTCPSGLFFNKAADSCDFARNVLCKKPSATTKATTRAATTAAATTSTSTTTTTRRPIKLSTKNSVLFRTTTTSTTPEPESEEEYEDELEDAADIEAEDPKVIKELIDLIRKVGGVDQLEKHLRLSETSASTDGATSSTPSSLNKKLYKVLERTRGKSKFGGGSAPEASSNTNSRRGPQNAGLEPSADKNVLLRKDKPQYTTINRSRSTSTTRQPDSEDVEDDSSNDTRPASRARVVEPEASTGTTSKTLQYVNIRRARPTYTSDTADDTASRNALFERAEPYVAIAETPSSLDILSARRENTPEYVTIRRQRPSTEETTPQYQNTELNDELQGTALEREISSQPQYTSIVRARSTTLPPPEGLASPDPTTILAVQISSLLNSPSPTEAETLETETEAPPTEDTDPTTVIITSTSTTTKTTTTTTTEGPSVFLASTGTPRQNPLRRRGSTTLAPFTSSQSLKERLNNFHRRKTTTELPDTTDTEAETETIGAETTTAKYPRRGTPKFKFRKEVQKTEEQKEQKERPYLYGGARRSEAPRRNYLRRRPSGASGTNINGNIVSTTIASLAARRPFRVASRRRPFNLTSTSSTSTTSTTTTTTQATDLDDSEEVLQDVEENDYVDSSPPIVNPKTNKIQRRPLLALKEERPLASIDEEEPLISQKEDDQNPSATNEEEKRRQSKKYTAVGKKNRLNRVEQALKDRDGDEEYYTTTDKKTTGDNEDVSAETAVAIAAHQLLSAPIPIIPNYEEDTKTYRKTSSPKTITEFDFTSPQYTDAFIDSRKTVYTDDYSSTTLAPNKGYNIQTSTGPAYSLSSFSSSDFDAPKITPTTSFAPKTTYRTNAFTAKISQPPVVSEPTITHTGLTGTRYPLAKPTFANEYTTKDASSAEYSEPTLINSEVPTKLSYSDLPTTNFDLPKSTFRTTFPTQESDISRFSARPITSDISSTTFSAPKSSRNKNTRYRPSTNINSGLESSTPPTGRYLGSSTKLIPVPVEDYAFSTDGYTGLSQEPAYFTREYLLESPVTKTYDDEYQYLSPVTTPQTTTRKLPRKKIHRKISTTQRPTTQAFVPVVTTAKPRRVSTVKPFEKKPARTYRPILNYDYYDDSEEKVAEKYIEGTKVVLHAKGTIECLDIGNFPHPTSCKKFISCARMESGALLGWEYVCPKGLSFDPVGGICNWSAGLGCVEKEA